MMEYRIYENPMIFCVLSPLFVLPVNPMLAPFHQVTVQADSHEDAIDQYQKWKADG